MSGLTSKRCLIERLDRHEISAMERQAQKPRRRKPGERAGAA